MKMFKITVTAVIMGLTSVMAAGQIDAKPDTLMWKAEALGTVSSGDFSPYHITALRHGRLSSSKTMLVEGSVCKPMTTDRNWDFGFGADIIAGAGSAVDYERYSASDHSWYLHPMRPSTAWVQQLYGEARWRSLFITVGLKEYTSPLVDEQLSSGDLVFSGNTRPMPQLRVGFNDFQTIPFTRGFLQIQAEVGIGKRMDDKWMREHYNYYNYYLSQGEWMNYKRLYFRTDPSRPFSATIGAQVTAEFWGCVQNYSKGESNYERKRPKSFGSLLRSIIPSGDGQEGFVEGNHLGSIDVKGTYRMRSGHTIKAYLSWPWEDGSGLGKLNGFDGLWGFEYRSPRRSWLNAAVVEYLNFTNHSGHIHINPDDWGDGFAALFPGHVSGSDDYYNHVEYNSYAYYGLSIGSPAFMAPLYNRDGYNRFIGNVMRGFHMAFTGSLSSTVDYTAKCSYRKAWGSGYFHLVEPIDESSFMVGLHWQLPRVKGLALNIDMELDRGTMPGNTFGVTLGVKWTGRSLANFTRR